MNIGNIRSSMSKMSGNYYDCPRCKCKARDLFQTHMTDKEYLCELCCHELLPEVHHTMWAGIPSNEGLNSQYYCPPMCVHRLFRELGDMDAALTYKKFMGG
jgi:hypothetical protein